GDGVSCWYHPWGDLDWIVESADRRMTVSYVGSLSIGGALPGAALALESAIPDLQARLDALASFAPTTGSLSANLALANGILSNIQNAITLGVVLPDISA